MNTIWKYMIENLNGDSKITVPENSMILSAKNQNENLCVWFLVNPRSELKEKCITCCLTGSASKHNLHESHVFIGTVLFDNGNFIVHVFEKLL